MRERTGKKKTRLDGWVKSSATPIFLISASRRLLFFNGGCEQLTGWRADDVIGEVAEFHSDLDAASPRALVNAICPPAEVFAGQERDVPVFLPNRKGPPLAMLLRFVPLREDEERIRSVLGLISPLPPPPAMAKESLAQRYHGELSALRWSLKQRYQISTVVARDLSMNRVLSQLAVARGSLVPIHFVGARGVGKEHLARAIHHETEAQHGAFVPLDCRQAPHLLLQTLQRLLHPEDETAARFGALSPRVLFLSDVGELPRDVQERLWESYRPDASQSGRRQPLPRLMSSSSESLETALADERIREELFYLLTTLTIDVPLLCDRRNDLPLLAQAFLEADNRGADRQLTGFADAVWPLFHEYRWPGNLDELRLVVQEAREKCTGAVIDVPHLPLRFRAGLDAQELGPAQPLPGEVPIPPLEAHLASIERELIERALKKAKQNKTLAAKLLSIPRPVLYRRIQALGLLDQ